MTLCSYFYKFSYVCMRFLFFCNRTRCLGGTEYTQAAQLWGVHIKYCERVMTQIQESELLANEQTNSKRKRSDLIEECATRTEENEIDNRRRRRQSAAFQQRRRSLVTYNNINDDKSSQRFGEIYARIIKLSSENVLVSASNFLCGRLWSKIIGNRK